MLWKTSESHYFPQGGGDSFDFCDGGDHVHIWGSEIYEDEHIWGLRF